MSNIIDVILKATDNITSPTHSATNALTNLGKAAANVHDKAFVPLRNMLQTGIKVAAGAAVTALVGLGATIGSSVGDAMEMEQELADISSNMGTTAEETNKLKKLITDLGFDPKLKVTATEAAEAIQTLGTAGLETTEILNGAAKSTVLLANATGADFSTAAEIATDVMAQFNIKAENMLDAVDGITATTIASKFGIQDYRLALAQAGGVAATVGVEFDDFNATIAAISPYFASGSDAGTSFKTFLQRLIPQSSEARDAMRDLGLFTGLSKKEFEGAQAQIQKYTAELVALDPASKNFSERSAELNIKIDALKSSLVEGSNAFFDANGNMKSMAEISGILNNAFAGLTEEQKNSTLATIFGTDAMRAAAAMAGMTEKDFLALKVTMSKTDAEQNAAVRMNTLSGVMEILGGVVDSLKLQIGDAFLPVLRRLAETFTEQATIHGPKLVEMFQKLAAQVAVSMEKFLPWVVEMLPKWIEQIPIVVAGISDFVREFTRIAGVVWEAISPVVEWLTKAENLKITLSALGLVLAGPLIVSIVGIISSILSLVGAFGSVLLAINPVVLIIGTLVAAAYGLYVAWQNNFLGIRDITASVIETVKGWFGGLPASLDSAKEAFLGWGSGAMQKLKEGFNIAAAPVKAELQNIVRDVSEHGVIFAIGSHAGRMYEAARGAITRFAEGFKEAAPNLSGDVQRILGGIIDVVNTFSSGGAGHLFVKAKEIMGRFAEGFKGVDLTGVFQTSVAGIVSFINSWSPGTAGHLFTKATEVVNRFKEGFSGMNVAGAFQTGVSGIVDFINTWAPGTGSHLFVKAKEVFARFAEGFTGFDFVSGLRNSLSKVVDAVNWWSDNSREHVWLKAKEYGGRLMEGLRDGIREVWSQVLSSINEITNALPQWIKDRLGIHSPSTVFAEIGRNLMQGLAQGLEQSFSLPELAMNTATDGLVGQAVSTVFNRQDQRQYNFNISNPVGASTNPTAEIQTLRSIYGSR